MLAIDSVFYAMNCGSALLLRAAIFALFILEQCILVYWIEEDSLTVVEEDRVDGVHSVGEMCGVKCGKNVYKGKIAATGKTCCC